MEEVIQTQTLNLMLQTCVLGLDLKEHFVTFIEI